MGGLFSRQADVLFTLTHSFLGPFTLCRLVCPDSERRGEHCADGSGDGKPEGEPDLAVISKLEDASLASAVHLIDDFRAPSGWIGDQAQGEEDGGKRLERPTNGEHRTADASPAADGE